ncbi:elongation factor G [bacterium]|nr:elongation factor G [bacterium]
MGVPIEKKRNLALIGHGGAGKTILAEALLNIAGATTRMGTIEDGNTVSDHAAEEIKRQYSVHSTVLPFDHDGFHVTLIDCPGYLDFIGDSIAALNVVDAAIIVVNGVVGVEPQTRQAWETCVKLGIPRLLFISSLDKENSSWSKSFASCREAFGKSLAPLCITIGEQHGLKGGVNVLTRKAYIRDGDKIVEQEIPDELKDAVEEARMELVETIVEQDEGLLERYLADEQIGEEELFKTLQDATGRGDITAVVGGAGKLKIGVRNLLELIKTCLPHPGSRGTVSARKPGGGEERRALTTGAPFCARVFKLTAEGKLGDIYWMRVFSGILRPGNTAYNTNASESEKISSLLIMRGKAREDVTQSEAGDIVATVKLKSTHIGDTLCTKDEPIVFAGIQYPSAVAYETVEVADKNDLEKCIASLNQYAASDDTLRILHDEETKELVVHGMGQLHLDIAAAFVKARTGVEVNWRKPRIPYRETITAKAEAQGKFKKQTGGRGKYGDAHLRLEPLGRGEGFEFVNKIVGGVVPNRFIPAVEKGVVESMSSGPLSGSRVIDLRATLFYGSYHTVDSDEISFKVAASIAFKDAFEQARPMILEPVYDVTIFTPDEYMGDVMADINTRRGRVAGMDQAGGLKTITAQIPLAELYQYINTLRSMSQGQGYYEMQFSHYEQVPANIQEAIMRAHKKEKHAEA